MKLIYTKQYNEYYSLWVKIRSNTNLVIESGSPTDSEDRMVAEFKGVSLCGMVCATESYIEGVLGYAEDSFEIVPIVDALKEKLSDYPTREEVKALSV